MFKTFKVSRTKNIIERAEPKKFHLLCITLCKQIHSFIKVKMGFQNKWIILQPMRLSDEEISRRTRDGV